MGKVFQNKHCDFCDYFGKVIETWGKKYCKKCYDNKPKNDTPGHSGMLFDANALCELELPFEKELHLRHVPKGDKLFASLYLQHYPKSKGIVGRQFNYIVEVNGHPFGIIGGNSPPLNYKLFNEYFGKKYSEINWLNNNVYRLTVKEKNLGTKVLKLFRNRVKKDYENKYKTKLIGLITFVEPPRTGSMYKADNWKYLGMTQGKQCKRRGDHGKWINKEWSEGVKKHIYARFL